MFAILKKELKQFFLTPVFYFTVVGVYVVQILGTANSGASNWFEQLSMSMGLFIIGVGSGLISKEFSLKTHKLLFSAPISTWSIIIGKYMAIVCSFMVVFFIMFFIDFFILKICFGGIVIVQDYVFGIMGAIFLIAFFSSVVIFLSTWCSNGGLVAALGYTGFMILSLGDFFVTGAGIYKNFFTKLFATVFQFSHPYHKICCGIIGLDSVLYFLGSISVFLFLAKLFLESKRYM